MTDESEDRPARIVCIDDDPITIAVYRRILTERGYDVSTCPDGATAKTRLPLEQPDLILLDMQLPDTDGTQILKFLRSHPDLHQCPVIVISSQKSEAEMTDAISLGANDYLVKPIGPGELVAKIKFALRSARMRSLTTRGIQLGRLFNIRYDIKEELGHGGFGTVYRAEDTLSTPPKTVALKVWHVSGDPDRDQEDMRLFLRESYEHSRLEHPNIVRLLDFGQSDGVFFMVTEFIAGESLGSIIIRENRIDEPEAVRIGLHIARALAYLAERHVVHRDVKPGNIMLADDGRILLLDFGLARQDADLTLSVDGKFRGSPNFVSPEHVRGEGAIDARADLYSLAATLFVAVTGESLFYVENVVQVLWAHLEEPPKQIQKVRPDISDEFAYLIHGMLEKTADSRLGFDAVIAGFESLHDHYQ